MPLGSRVAKRRGAGGPTEQEMVSLVGSDSKRSSSPPKSGNKSGKAFPALNRVLGGGYDELKVSLLDSDGKPTTGGMRGPRTAKSAKWDRKRIMRYAALGFASFIVSYLWFNRERDIHWESFNKILNPTATGDKKCFVRYSCSILQN